jgi:hypothetical protein
MIAPYRPPWRFGRFLPPTTAEDGGGKELRRKSQMVLFWELLERKQGHHGARLPEWFEVKGIVAVFGCSSRTVAQ